MVSSAPEEQLASDQAEKEEKLAEESAREAALVKEPVISRGVAPLTVVVVVAGGGGVARMAPTETARYHLDQVRSDERPSSAQLRNQKMRYVVRGSEKKLQYREESITQQLALAPYPVRYMKSR
ncbi:hypothetical protein Q1695_015675 [Nippostrongylus brasiliensis]|nr:hypothetical protein Q1695_015675 [Nippostrongylus brasiliensis]